MWAHSLGGSSGSHVDSDDPLAARFWSPTGICTDREGNALLSEHEGHSIRIILRNGSVRTLAGDGSGGCVDNADPLLAKFLHPHGITSIVENGKRLVIIGGHFDHRIRVIYANRTVSTLAGSGNTGWMDCHSADNISPLAASFCHPMGVAPDRFGNIIVAEFLGGRVRKVWRDGSQSGVTTVAGRAPVGTSGGSSVDSDTPADASLFTPVGIVVDGGDNILVSCSCEHRIRIILVNGSVRTLAGSGPSNDLATTGESNGGFVDNVPLLRARLCAPPLFGIRSTGQRYLCRRF